MDNALMPEETPEEARRVRLGLCWGCGHEDGVHTRSDCRGGEDVLCRCDGFESPVD